MFADTARQRRGRVWLRKLTQGSKGVPTTSLAHCSQISIHSLFFHSFNKHLLSKYQVAGTLLKVINATQSIRISPINARRGVSRGPLGHMEEIIHQKGSPWCTENKEEAGGGKAGRPKHCKQGELHPEAQARGLSRIGWRNAHQPL